jgi:DNA-binding PadR family transcriptional regulator
MSTSKRIKTTMRETVAAIVPYVQEQDNSYKSISWYLGETPKVLTDVQRAAIDLHQRGFNVFPLPTARAWLLRPDEDGKIKKAPYTGLKLSKLYASRLHFDLSFVMLFENANIGVVCGRTSGNLVAIDCDSVEAYNYVGKKLSERGIGFWSTNSSRGGHYLMRIQEGEAANISKGNLMGLPKRIRKDVEVLGHRHYIVLPPSIHPLSGAAYQWKGAEGPSFVPPSEDIPAVSIRDLEWLGLRLAAKAKQEERARPAGLENVSARNYEFWQRGTAKGERNKKLTALLYDLAADGVEEENAFEIALIAAKRCTPPYSKSHLRQMVKSAYDSPRTPARSFYDENPSLRSHQDNDSAPKQEWEVISEFAQNFDWRSQKWTYTSEIRTGLCKGYYQVGTLKAGTVKRVFLALVERFRMEGRSIFRASEREVSEIATMGTKTVRYAIRALLEAGLILSKGKTREDARLISFGDISRMTALFTPLSSSAVILEKNNPLPKTDAEKDVFGSSPTYIIWRHLLVTPEKNANQTAQHMSLPPSTVYAAFDRLQKIGLISKNEEGKYVGLAMTDAALEELSVELGTHGKAQRKVEQHKLQRQTHLNADFRSVKSKYQAETVRLMAEQESVITATPPVLVSSSSPSKTISERVEQTSDASTFSYTDVKDSMHSAKDNAKAPLALKNQHKKASVDLVQQSIPAIRQVSERLEVERNERWLQVQATYQKMRNTPYSMDQDFPPTYGQFSYLQTHEERRTALQQADKEWYEAHPIWSEAIKDNYRARVLAYGD